MRPITLTIFLAILTMKGFGQSLFFDNLENSKWTSEKIFSDSTLKKEKEILLHKLWTSINDLKTNRTIWTFRDSLIISYYDVVTRKEIAISTYKYEVNRDKGLLRIILDDKLIFSNEIGIVSTGNYVLLIRKKK